MESRTVTKWESDGWELVSQTPRKLRTELTFRRPKPKTRWLPWVAGGAVLAGALAVIIVVGVVSERNAAPSSSPSAAPSESAVLPKASPSAAAPTTAPPVQPQDVALTPQNNSELAAVLALGDNCDPSIAAFAETYRGRTISFPGNVAVLGPHGGATTRYDILVGAGDFSETSASGPTFQFRDVNTTDDLHFVGTGPDTIGAGTNLDVTAQVDEYEASSCLFLLDPVSTAVR